MIAGQSLTVQPFIRPYKTSPQVTHPTSTGGVGERGGARSRVPTPYFQENTRPITRRVA